MKPLFDFDLKKIPITSKKEESERKKNLELFLKTGLPNKKKWELEIYRFKFNNK